MLSNDTYQKLSPRIRTLQSSAYIQLDENANQNKREIDDEFIRRYVFGIFASAGNLPLKMQVPFTRDSPN